jgi:hypothetical protein
VLGLTVQSLPYALELLTEVDPISTVLGIAATKPFLGGSFVITGIAADLVPSSPAMNAETGSLVVTGIGAGVLRGGRLATAPGSIAVTGIAASLRLSNYTFAVSAGSFAVTGTSATTKVGRQSSAEPGSVTVTGIAANLVPPGSSGLWLFPLDPLFLFDTF